MAKRVFERVASDGIFEFLDAAVTHGRAFLSARLGSRPGPHEQSFTVSAVIDGSRETFPVRVFCAVTGLGGPSRIIFREDRPKGSSTDRAYWYYAVVSVTPQGVQEVEGIYTGPGECVRQLEVITAISDATTPSSGEEAEQ